MAIVRRLAPSALIATLAVTTAACGSATVVSSAAPSGAASRFVSPWPAKVWYGSDPLAGRSPGWILRRTFTDAEAAPVVRVQGTMVKAGHGYTFDLLLAAGHGCAGTVTRVGTGRLTLISDGNTLWMKPDAAYWLATGASRATLIVMGGKYLKAKPDSSGATAVATVCSVRNLLRGFTPVRAGGAIRGDAVAIDGRWVVQISDSAGAAYAYVTDARQPKLLQISNPGAGEIQVSLSYPGTPAAITPPPASQIIDGKGYGFLPAGSPLASRFGQRLGETEPRV